MNSRRRSPKGFCGLRDSTPGTPSMGEEGAPLDSIIASTKAQFKCLSNSVRVGRVLSIVKSHLVIHQPQAKAVSLRIQRPLPRIAEIGGTDLRQAIYVQIPHLAKGILAPILPAPACPGRTVQGTAPSWPGRDRAGIGGRMPKAACPGCISRAAAGCPRWQSINLKYLEP